MSIHPGHLREYIIRPVLKRMGAYSEAAEELMMLTAAAESECGHYLHQVGGPALGIYQMEPATFHDINDNFLAYKDHLKQSVDYYGAGVGGMVGNLYFATAMTRCHYLRRPESLPSPIDILGMAEYWKRFYNSYMGAGMVSEAIQKYKRFALVD